MSLETADRAPWRDTKLAREKHVVRHQLDALGQEAVQFDEGLDRAEEPVTFSPAS